MTASMPVDAFLCFLTWCTGYTFANSISMSSLSKLTLLSEPDLLKKFRILVRINSDCLLDDRIAKASCLNYSVDSSVEIPVSSSMKGDLNCVKSLMSRS